MTRPPYWFHTWSNQGNAFRSQNSFLSELSSETRREKEKKIETGTWIRTADLFHCDSRPRLLDSRSAHWHFVCWYFVCHTPTGSVACFLVTYRTKLRLNWLGKYYDVTRLNKKHKLQFSHINIKGLFLLLLIFTLLSVDKSMQLQPGRLAQRESVHFVNCFQQGPAFCWAVCWDFFLAINLHNAWRHSWKNVSGKSAIYWKQAVTVFLVVKWL